MSATTYQSRPFGWIVGPRYDRALIFGGAAASLCAPLLVWWRPGLLAPLFWVWLFFFDGTHSWATYSRTYADADFRRENRRLLFGSLVWFALPAAAILLWGATGSLGPVHLFLLAAQFWSYHHIVRQHYGFASIYDRKALADRRSHLATKWALYLGLWVPYFYFLLTHPLNRRIMSESPGGLPAIDYGWWDAALGYAAPAFSGALLIGLLAYQGRRRAGRGGRFGLSPAHLFVAACVLLYSVIFYVIAPLEPLLPGARTPVQSFMLMQVMITLFHNIQYHAIVWHYNRNRPRRASLNRNFVVYALVGLTFSLVYVAAAWHTTEYPSWRGEVPENVLVPAAFCVWWGLSLHHYYLDQKIWRVSKAHDLQRQLGIEA
ncbi:MAG TPA: hypothetical protein VGX48_25490 [Pyrinomonadaceae bacterium]|jgi:hypothetical protein|nr:hypothetical protein [Pyrinomonadaceae bacterium]